MLAQHRQRELHKPPADILLSYSCFIPGRSCTASHAQFSPPTSVLRSWLLGMLSIPWLVSLEQFVASHSLPLALLSEPPSTTPARLEVLSAAHIGTTSSSPRHWFHNPLMQAMCREIWQRGPGALPNALRGPNRAVFLVEWQPRSLCSAVLGGCPHHCLLLPTQHPACVTAQTFLHGVGPVPDPLQTTGVEEDL